MLLIPAAKVTTTVLPVLATKVPVPLKEAVAVAVQKPKLAPFLTVNAPGVLIVFAVYKETTPVPAIVTLPVNVFGRPAVD